MKDKKNNYLRTTSKKSHNGQFSLQMALPHPMNLKPRVYKTSNIEKKNTTQLGHKDNKQFKIQMALPKPMLMKPGVSESIKTKENFDSRVPYYTAFIQAKEQARKNRQRLLDNKI